MFENSIVQALIAQLVEQATLNRRVPGSSPGEGTDRKITSGCGVLEARLVWDQEFARCKQVRFLSSRRFGTLAGADQ